MIEKNVSDKTISLILEKKLIAIIRGADIDTVLPTAQALYDGGIRLLEVTFNHKSPETYVETLKCIESINKQFGENLITGAGTVLTPDQAESACNAGAKYIVSPNTDADVIRKTKKLGMISVPGAFTPTECVAAHNFGADFIKLFPAGEVGPDYLKALCAPLSHLRFIAVGGITETNIPLYLNSGATALAVGSNLANKSWIKSGNFTKITETAKKYVSAV